MGKRVRGMADWKPQPHVQAVMGQVEEVLEEYEEHLPLTIRQIFYRLVGKYGFEKTETAYNRLAEYLNRARRSGRIPFEHIRDDGVSSSKAGGFESADAFVRGVLGAARSFRLTRLDGQHQHVEIWAEAAGMVPQVSRVSHEYGIDAYSSSGFNSTTVKRAIAERLAYEERSVVLHIGDLDPSGVAIFDSLSEDVEALAEAIDPAAWVSFERVAVTPEQVEEYGLPGSPPKRTDRRSNYQGQTVQAEALPPSVLAELVRAAIFEHIDEGTWRETLEHEVLERAALVERLEELIGE
jgi:hypothetical protein